MSFKPISDISSELLPYLLVGAILVATIFNLPALALDPVEYDPIIVKAEIDHDLIENEPALTYSSKELQELGARNVSDALRLFPGVHLLDYTGGASSVFVRGGDPNFTLILLDGMPINSPTDSRGGIFDLSKLLLNSIDRIELSYVPSNGYNGPSGLTSTLKIYSLRPRSKTKVSLDRSYNNYRQVSANLNDAESNLGSSLSYRDTGSWYQGSNQSATNALVKYEDLSENGTYKSLQMFGINSHQKFFPDDSGGYKYSTLRDRQIENFNQISATANIEKFVWRKTSNDLILGVLTSESSSDSPGVLPGVRDPIGIPNNTFDTRFSRLFSKTTTTTKIYSIPSWLSLEENYENGSEEGMLFGQGYNFDTDYSTSRNTFTLSSGVSPRVTKNINLYYEYRLLKISSFGVKNLHNSGITVSNIIPNAEINLSWRNGYKAPSFYAQHNPIVGNLGIQPEESNSLNLSVSRSLSDRLSLQINTFRTKYKNLIDFDGGPPPALINRTSIVSTGSEVMLRSLPGSYIDWSTSLSYLNVSSASEDAILRFRPRWTANSILQKKFGILNAYGTFIYVAERKDSSIPTGDLTLPSYYLVNIGLKYDLRENMYTFLKIDNILNRSYENSIGNVGPKLMPIIGIEASI